jgi:hypothetical protein
MQFLKDYVKRVLPDPILGWIRRRKAVRIYLKELGYELHNAETSLDPEEVEARLAARREGSFGLLLKDVLERTDLLIQQLDRRIEGFTVRFEGELRVLKAQVEELRDRLGDIGPAGHPRQLPSSSEGGPITQRSAGDDPEEASATIGPSHE